VHANPSQLSRWHTQWFGRTTVVHFEGPGKKGGTVVTRSKIVVSKDGKILTLTTTGTSAKGQKVHKVEVFDKQ
jgi:hypothetical protein